MDPPVVFRVDHQAVARGGGQGNAGQLGEQLQQGGLPELPTKGKMPVSLGNRVARASNLQKQFSQMKIFHFSSISDVIIFTPLLIHTNKRQHRVASYD